jgi:hypothetical protein
VGGGANEDALGGNGPVGGGASGVVGGPARGAVAPNGEYKGGGVLGDAPVFAASPYTKFD